MLGRFPEAALETRQIYVRPTASTKLKAGTARVAIFWGTQKLSELGSRHRSFAMMSQASRKRSKSWLSLMHAA